jgi:predicted AAA+ superfamily ATPase
MNTLKQKNIIYYDFNDIELQELTYKELYKKIIAQSKINVINYIFLDEIQEINEFEKCVISLFEHKTLKFDIVITGSNSKMFSAELATLFTGRNVEIHVLPLSFSEIHDFLRKNLKYDKKRNTDNEIFEHYLKYGGMPILLEIINNTSLIKNRLNKILDDVIDKDVRTRHKIKNVSEFKRIAQFIFDNNGNVTSTISIHNYLISNKIGEITRPTLDNYQKWMMDSLIIYKNPYYDLKGKRVLNTSSKYYCVDTGIKNVNTNFKNEGKLLENIAFLELLRNNYEVYSLKLRNEKEIDFLIIKDHKKTYIQVAKNLDTEKIKNREIGNLISINDNNRKIVIVCEGESYVDDNGIEIINIIDWLLGKVKI